VQFHGNAGNITSHYSSLEWVTARGYDFFTFDYRGYGRSGSVPSRVGVQADARAALDYALARAKPRAEPDLVLYGQSLGGAVLLRMLGGLSERERIRAVVVEGTFHSYQDAAAAVLWSRPMTAPLAGFGYSLVSDDFSPSAYIERVSPIPLLVIHDVRDPVVPFGFGRAVYNLAREPKELWPVDYGDHLGATRDPALRSELIAWMDRPGPARSTK
jgi:fermentation-respiration switch protein FrsA (DUF1100 family)